MVIGRKEYGPVEDKVLLELIDSGEINTKSDLRSPNLTHNQWHSFEEINLAVIRERVAQRTAETTRIEKEAARANRTATDNREKLRRVIKDAIGDGLLTSDEQSEIDDLATSLDVPSKEVSNILNSECSSLLNEVMNEVMEDGILDTEEEQRVMAVAKKLGVQLTLTEKQKRDLSLCRHAYRISNKPLEDFDVIDADFKLQAKEECYTSNVLEWMGVVQTKRPSGLPIGDNTYLKSMATGMCYISNKHVTLVNNLETKKVRNTSISKVEIYSDGIFLNRTTGKSVFLRFLESDFNQLSFALTAQRVINDSPVQAHLSAPAFIPPPPEDTAPESEFISAILVTEPRYTFRVVGEHIGLRAYTISRLTIGDRIILQREPENPHDSNAVLVLDSSGAELGYLKREVALWFAKLLDSGRQFNYTTYRVHDDGRLIIAAYEV
jgi:hypothetical protein